MEEEEEEDEEQVMSEVHVGCPPHLSGSYTSHFTFLFPPTAIHRQLGFDEHNCQEDASNNLTVDEDGDLVLSRRGNSHRRCLYCQLTIQHSITSSLSCVGLQVWRAALVLADFVLHKSFTSSDFDDIIAIELGAGTGLVGIILARAARTVFLTDVGIDVLDNCTINAHFNSSTLKFHETSVRIRELNWKESWPPNIESTDALRPKYRWASTEIEEAEGASLLLAADVIYSNELTDSFFNVVEKLMSRGSKKVLYLALEKRYNFALDDLEVVANGYTHFRSYFKDEEECVRLDASSLPCFIGEQIDLNEMPQYIREYERGKDLEIWKITYATTVH